MSIWNKITVMNPIQEQHLLYKYNLHKQSLESIQQQKAKRIDNKKPYLKNSKTQQTQHYSKQQRTRDLDIDIENGSLMHKMLEINTLPGIYNKNILGKSVSNLSKPQMTLNMPQRIQTIKKVNEENTQIHKRIKNVQSTISFKSLKKDYKKQKQYSKNITNSSRRIYNCFLFNSQNNSVMSSQNLSKFNSTKRHTQRSQLNSQPFSPTHSKQHNDQNSQLEDPIKEQDQALNNDQEQQNESQQKIEQNDQQNQEQEPIQQNENENQVQETVKNENENNQQETIKVEAEKQDDQLEESKLPEELQQSPAKSQIKAEEQQNEEQK